MNGKGECLTHGGHPMLADIIIKIAFEQGKEEERAPYRPRPSSAGPERCIRSLVYHSMAVERAPLPGRAFLVFDDGGWHESLTADWIRKSSFKLHSEQMRVETPVGVGSIDGIITDLLGVDRLWEHKAMSTYAWERYWNGGFPLDYFTQCALYVNGLQKVNPNLNEALLLDKNKNTAQYLEFLLRYDAEQDSLRIVEMVRSDGERQTPEWEYVGITTDAVAKFAEVEKHRTAGPLPPRPHLFGTDFPCSYCLWNRTCWENFAEEMAALPKEVELEISEVLERFQAVKLTEAAAKKEKDELRERILGHLSALNVSGGRAGRWNVQAKVQKRAGFTVEPSEFIVLNVSQKKEKKS